MAEEKLRRKSTKLIREGKYAAQVEVEFWYDESWSPMMSIDDIRPKEYGWPCTTAILPKQRRTAKCLS